MDMVVLDEPGNVKNSLKNTILSPLKRMSIAYNEKREKYSYLQFISININLAFPYLLVVQKKLNYRIFV